MLRKAHGCGIAAQQGCDGSLIEIAKGQLHARAIKQDQCFTAAARGALPVDGEAIPGRVEKGQGQRNRQGLGGCGGQRQVLRQFQRVTARRRIEYPCRLKYRRAGPGVPGQPGRQVTLVGVAQRREEILDGHGGTVVAIEIKIHAATKTVPAQHGRQHAHDLGTFLVNGCRVEIVDFAVLQGPHRMRQRPRILAELVAPEDAHILDAAQRARGLLGDELLLTIDRQAFLEAQLEPVAAGHPVACPVVEILVGDDGQHVPVVVIGRMQWIGQQVLRVEDVETGVFHGTHGEIVGGDDMEDIQVVVAPETLLVPEHGRLEAIQRIPAARDQRRGCPDLQAHQATFGGAVLILDDGKAAGDDGEQITRFGLRIDHAHPMTAIRQFAGSIHIATGKQHRKARAIRAQGHRVAGQHIGAVDRPGDVAKAFGFTLAEQEALFRATTQVKALHRLVVGRADA